MNKYYTIKENDLTLFTNSVFKAIGCSDIDATLATDVLIKADLRGIESHGVARLSGYVRLFEAGRINTKPNIKITRQKAGTFTLDGDAGLGLVVAPRAMEIAIEKCRITGSAYGAIGNSNHFGIAAYHALMAVPHNFIGMSMTNASPLVAPTHSNERMLGTNPICYAIPAGKYPPFVLDMATSAAANGKLEIAERANKEIPTGWVEKQNGEPTNDPKELKNGGYLLPLGSDTDHGNHKGYGLGALVDILSGVLSGANFGPWVPPFVSFLPVLPNLPGKGLGHFLGVMDIDGFIEISEFNARMEQWIERFKNAKAKGTEKVIIHGEPEQQQYEQRKKEGILLIDKVCNDLIAVAQKYKIEHPFYKNKFDN